MTEEEILENNKIIAKFIEYIPIYLNSNYDRLKCFCDEFITCPQCKGLEEAETYGYFHSSWNWLMPVVNKICDYEEVGDFEIGNSYIQIIAAIEVDKPINDILINHSGGDDKIRAVFEACVKFIKQIK